MPPRTGRGKSWRRQTGVHFWIHPAESLEEAPVGREQPPPPGPRGPVGPSRVESAAAHARSAWGMGRSSPRVAGSASGRAMAAVAVAVSPQHQQREEGEGREGRGGDGRGGGNGKWGAASAAATGVTAVAGGSVGKV
jgi:hypothetical protein